MTTLRALHVLRDDHASHIGGDVSEVHGVVEGLCRHGIDAMAATLPQAPDSVDIVNLYNLWLPREFVAAHTEARARWPLASIVLTPIFDTYDVRQVLRSADRHLVAKAARRVARGRTTRGAVRRALADTQLLLPNTTAEARRVSRYFAVDRPSVVVPNGVWSDRWQPPAEPDHRHRILRAHDVDPDAELVITCVARLEPRKNQRGVIRAVERIDGATLLLVGPIAHRRYGAAVLSEAEGRLPGRWRWTGPQDAEAVRDLIAASDVLVLASYLEVAPTVAVEAATLGCEVVLADTPANREIWGGTAHLCRPDRTASIAAAIEAAIEAPWQPATAVRAAAFDFDRIGAITAAAYRALGQRMDR